jgi:GNAT superfamily N-acetyltransferase
MNGYQIISESLNIIISKAPDPTVKLKNIRYDAHYNGNNIAFILLIEPVVDSKNNIYLRSFYIKKPFRGKGLARLMLTKIRQDFWDKNIVLKAEPFGKGKDMTRDELIQMYKHFGFVDYPYKEDRLWLPKRKKIK